MSEMIERAAKAIREAQQKAMAEADKTGVLDQRKLDLIAARAALEAMREPTEAMVEAGDEAAEGETYDRNGGQAAFSLHGSKPVWQAMIDEALK